MTMGRTYSAQKKILLRKILKGRHKCLICVAGNSRFAFGKNQFVRMRRSKD